jgi:CheY-like chemotaxis protein
MNALLVSWAFFANQMKKPSETATLSVRRVLLIDDNRNGLVARKFVLSGEGYAVTACDGPGEALELFSAEDFDLVVTDYRMPGMNGAELILEFRSRKPAIPIVLISGMVDVLGLNEQNTGADAVVAKSASEVPHMIRAVNRLLNKQVPCRKPVRSQIGRIATTRAHSG